MTSSAAFETGQGHRPEHAGPRADPLTLPGSTTQLINDNGEPAATARPPLLYAFTVSCNTAFGNLGCDLGGDTLRAQAKKYGFNNPNLTDPGCRSRRATSRSTRTTPQTALSAIGQQTTR